MGRDNDILQLEMGFDLAAEAPRIYSILGDELQWPTEFGARILKSVPNERLLLGLSNFTRVELNITPRSGGCNVHLQQDLLKSLEQKREARHAWREFFEQIQNRVS